MTNVIILGSIGNCIDILDTINEINAGLSTPTYNCAGFLDDDSDRWGVAIDGVRVLGPLTRAQEYPDCMFINGIGSASNYLQKPAIIDKTGISLDRFVTIIHPTASVSRMATLGVGCIIFQHVTITSNVVIGNHVAVLPNSIISHDSTVGDYTIVTGGVCISGGVTIGQSCYIGTNSAIRDYRTVGDQCLVGMGSVVVADAPENSVVVGNPASAMPKSRHKGATDSH